MLTAPAAVAGFPRQQTVRFAIVWEVARTDGVSHYFTSHDTRIPVEGQTYTPFGGVQGSAARREGQLVVHDREFSGALESAAITEEDLRAERFHDAVITERWVDWRYAAWGVIAKFRYRISEVTFDGRQWRCSCEGIVREISNEVGDQFGRPCRWDLGVIDPITEEGCGVNLASFTVGGLTPQTFGDGERRQVIRVDPTALAGAGTYPDGWFALGYIVVATGANAGLKAGVKRYVSQFRQIELFVPLPHPMTTSDGFALIAGCNKLLSTCKTKFSALQYFGGFDLPGTDAVLALKPGG